MYRKGIWNRQRELKRDIGLKIIIGCESNAERESEIGVQGRCWAREQYCTQKRIGLFARKPTETKTDCGSQNNRAKSEAYECGIEPSPQAAEGGRFPVKYFLTAMLFIIFDIEIVFLYPWAVTFDKLGLFGLVEMGIFVATVFVAYAYVWRRGGLEWD